MSDPHEAQCQHVQEAHEETVDPGRFGASLVPAHVTHVEVVSIAVMAELAVPVPALLHESRPMGVP
jgi:hypothetical protein